MNPQDNALMTFDNLIDTKLITKDAHRPLIERPIDQSASLPPACNNKIRLDWASRYSQSVSSQYPSVMLANCANIPKL